VALPIERAGVVVDVGDYAIGLILGRAYFLLAAIPRAIASGGETSATADMRIIIICGEAVFVRRHVF